MNTISAFFSKLCQKAKAISLKELLTNPLYTTFIFLAFLLPFVFTLSSLFLKKKEFDRLETQFEQIKVKMKKSAFDQKEKEDFLKKLDQAEPDFIDKEVQNISLKTVETSFFEKLGSQVKLNNKIEDTNRIYFESLGVVAKNQITEELLALKKPVEVEGDDINKLLSLIEGEVGGSPQLIFHSFNIKKGENSFGKESYFLDFTILKRERI